MITSHINCWTSCNVCCWKWNDLYYKNCCCSFDFSVCFIFTTRTKDFLFIQKAHLKMIKERILCEWNNNKKKMSSVFTNFLSDKSLKFIIESKSKVLLYHVYITKIFIIFVSSLGRTVDHIDIFTSEMYLKCSNTENKTISCPNCY